MTIKGIHYFNTATGQLSTAYHAIIVDGQEIYAANTYAECEVEFDLLTKNNNNK